MSGKTVVYFLTSASSSDTSAEEGDDHAEWLLASLAGYTDAELRELLYVGQEPGFFELVRGLFTIPDEARSTLQRFLASATPQATAAIMEADGRCVLSRGPCEPQKRFMPGSEQKASNAL